MDRFTSNQDQNGYRAILRMSRTFHQWKCFGFVI